VAAPFIVLLLLASVYLGRDRLSWFPSSQRRPIPYKQLTQEFVGNGKRKPDADQLQVVMKTLTVQAKFFRRSTLPNTSRQSMM
jgi:hypothetical protein